MTKKIVLYSITSLSFILILLILLFFRNNLNQNSLNLLFRKLSSGEHRLVLKHDGKLRNYILYIPKPYNKNKKYPLVFSFHGGGSDAREQIELNDLNQVADKEGFIVVYPNAVGNNWNDGRSYTIEKSGNSDDVAFIKEIISSLSRQVSIDHRKVYSTGISNGGMMSLRLACDAADSFAAVAPVASVMPEELEINCNPSQPISVLSVQGTADPLVPYDGGEIKGLAGRDTAGRGVLLSAAESLNFWSLHNKCSQFKDISFPDNDPNDGTTSIQRIYECNSGTEVGLITVSDGGHTWPGGKQYLGERLVGKVSRDFSASQIIWDFFKTKTR